MQTLKLRHEIKIHALSTKLWKVITSAQYTQQFLFEGEQVSDWKAGELIVLEEEKRGCRELVKKGMVHEVIPAVRLRFDLYEDADFENDLVHFQYELIPVEDGTRLILFQEMSYRSEDLHMIMIGNTKVMLQKIKWLAEYS